MRTNYTTCKSCGAKIMFVRTFGDRWIPVNVHPIEFYPDEGKELFVTSNGAVVHGTKAKEDADHTHVGYISHFATCPYADQHRRK